MHSANSCNSLLLSPTAGSSIGILNYSLTISNGIVSAMCITQTQGIENCSIQYGKDPFYDNLSPPVTGPINTPFLIPFMELSTATYYHQAIITINSSLVVIMRSNGRLTFPDFETSADTMFTTPENKNTVMLEAYHLGLVGSVILVLLILVLIMAVVIARLIHKGNNYYLTATKFN